MLAVTVSEFNSDLLARIKSESLLDPHFQDEKNYKNTRKYEKTAGYFTYQSRIVVPASMQTEIIREHHSNVVSGHFSWSRTYDLISRNFWWHGMREAIQEKKKKKKKKKVHPLCRERDVLETEGLSPRQLSRTLSLLALPVKEVRAPHRDLSVFSLL